MPEIEKQNSGGVFTVGERQATMENVVQEVISGRKEDEDITFKYFG